LQNKTLMDDIEKLLEKDDFSKEELLKLLSTEGEERRLLYAKAAGIKAQYVGRKVYYRGLVEFSNICGKNCHYCGIRRDNKNLTRYKPGR